VIDALTRFSAGDVPDASAMTTIGGLALAANLACAILLLKYRGDDINMRSTWLCSRNDALASAGVVVAGFAVSYWNSRVPDLVVGGAIAVLVLHSSWSIVRESILAIKRSG
jgi:Co/Zn/Cd efflux system component